MSDATLLIKKMPPDLKNWLATEAARHGRSMNKEAIHLLEEMRALRESVSAPPRDEKAIAQLLNGLRSLPVRDRRPIEDILYDEAGMPK